MNYIVFDLEWNQPATEEDTVTEPVYLTGEIIEIGAVKLNDAFETVDEKKIYVMPKYYTKLHNKIASLTGISNRTLQEQGLPFPEAFKEFQTWCGEEYTYMTWSESDLTALIENMLLHGMDISNLPDCCDAQRIFDREILREERKCSLDKAIEILGETGDKAHDALHDARNTVLVCNHMDLEEYIGEYTSRVFGEPSSSTVYESVSQALEAPELTDFVCPWCGEPVTAGNWIPLRGNRYMGMGCCGEEDEFIVYLNFNRCHEGWRVMRVFYEMSDDLWDQYQDGLEARQTANV